MKHKHKLIDNHNLNCNTKIGLIQQFKQINWNIALCVFPSTFYIISMFGIESILHMPYFFDGWTAVGLFVLLNLFCYIPLYISLFVSIIYLTKNFSITNLICLLISLWALTMLLFIMHYSVFNNKIVIEFLHQFINVP